MAFMRVLVVEDEVRMAALLRRGLSEEGSAVDVAGDGPEAVWRVARADDQTQPRASTTVR